MSLRDRLLNMARAELKSAARKVRASAEEILGGGSTSADRAWEEAARARDEAHERAAREDAAKRGAPEGMRYQEKIQRYYANLELPIGASLSEVKAAYRRLMRRYHPDLHQEDPAKAEVATKLAQELRTAYEGLIAHLERRPEK
jgi:DnaJ-domain-containing protein 1